MNPGRSDTFRIFLSCTGSYQYQLHDMTCLDGDIYHDPRIINF
nr:MAG TPA: hypothetical protein [Herelleviridae sp.]